MLFDVLNGALRRVLPASMWSRRTGIGEMSDTEFLCEVFRNGIFEIDFGKNKDCRRPHADHALHVVSAASACHQGQSEILHVAHRFQPLLLTYLKMPKRIGVMRVTSHLEHDRLRLEAFDSRQNASPECMEPDIAGRVRFERNVQRCELGASLFGKSRSWKECPATLMNAASEDRRIVVPDPLHAVPMMQVDIDVCDALKCFTEK